MKKPIMRMFEYHMEYTRNPEESASYIASDLRMSVYHVVKIITRITRGAITFNKQDLELAY